MPGVQSFVAQRRQGSQRLVRQILGAQNRVPVPKTKLENAKEKPSLPRPNPVQPADPPLAEQSLGLSSKHSAKASDFQGGFDTDTEGFDDTATVSIGGSSRGYQVEGNGPDPISGCHRADAANDIVSGVHVSFQRGQAQLHHVQGSRQLDAEGSGEEGNEESYGESSDAEEDEEPDKEKLVRDGILQDLNSPEFSQYLRADTSYTTQAAIQPVLATPVAQSGLVSRDFVQNSRKLTSLRTFTGNSVVSRVADSGVKLKRANRQAGENSGVSVQDVQGTSMEQLSIPAQQSQLSDHHESSQMPSVTSHQILWPTGVAQERVATYTLPQAKGERSLSIQKGSIDLGDDQSPANWDSDVDERHARRPTASIDNLQIRKRTRNLDYSPNHLSNMTFQQLSIEPFNVPAHTARTPIPQELLNSTLVTQVDYVLEELKDDHAKIEQRRAFFISLSTEQYEECANLIIHRFSAIMSKFTDAKQHRRRAAQGFEEEVAKREECVRGKLKVIDKNLARLKRKGGALL